MARRWQVKERIHPLQFQVVQTDPQLTPAGNSLWAVGLRRMAQGERPEEDDMVLQALIGTQQWSEGGGTFVRANTESVYRSRRRDAQGVMQGWLQEQLADYGGTRLSGMFKLCRSFTRETAHQGSALLFRDDEADLGIKHYQLCKRDDTLCALGTSAHVAHTLKEAAVAYPYSDAQGLAGMRLVFLKGQKRVVDSRTRERELRQQGFFRYGQAESVPGNPQLLQVSAEVQLPKSVAYLHEPPPPTQGLREVPTLSVPSGLIPIGF